MTHRIEAILMTLSHFQGYSYCKPFKCDFSYNCAAVDKISTDIARRAVSLRWRSFLLVKFSDVVRCGRIS